MLKKILLLPLLLLISQPAFSHSDLEFNAALQLRLERAGRLIAISFSLLHPDYPLYGSHPDYSQKSAKELIDKNIEITITTKHSLKEGPDDTLTIMGFHQYKKWLENVRKVDGITKYIEARTMGRCTDGCCDFSTDGGISHNTLYLTEACFAFKNSNPILTKIKIYDGD